MAGEILMSISTDERERAIFRSRRMYQSDQESNRLTELYNERRKIAKNLLYDGDSVDKVIRMTGLTRDEVETLRP